jgi:predicted Zn-dependent protease
MVVLPVLPILLLVLSPESMIHMYANLGAVAQTKAELSHYAGAQWPIQDELRRTPQVDLSLALRYYRSVMALEPRNITAQERIGQIALSQGDYQLAREHLSLAYAIAPQRNAVRLLLGEVTAITGSPDQAVALWQGIAVGKEQTLDERLWWYTSRNAVPEAVLVGDAVARAKEQADYSER